MARIVGESPHRVLAVCQKYVEMVCSLADHSDVTALAVDETSRAGVYKEQLREILDRKQINVMCAML